MNKDFYLIANNFINLTISEMKKIRSKKKYLNYFSESCLKKNLTSGKKYSDKNEIFEENDEDKKIKSLLQLLLEDEDINDDKKKLIKLFYDDFSIINDLKYEMEKRKINYIGIDDAHYPEKLKEIYDPPYILYYYGDISVLSKEVIIAVVGSRKMTEYGKNVTKFLVNELASKGVVIVSGLAKGVDSMAHRSCIDSEMPTIAVLGTPIDKVYPHDNIRLVSDIIKKGGLVISEYNYNKTTKKHYFALRNRIISGISLGVLITEAGEKSGALITGDCALNDGRNVYAVPGSIFSSMSRGCNSIIYQGAKPVQKSNDILEDIYELFSSKNDKNENKDSYFCKNTRNSTSNCDKISLDDAKIEDLRSEEVEIFNLLVSKGALSIDQISKITGLNVKDIIYSIGRLSFLDLIMDIGLNRYAPNILK